VGETTIKRREWLGAGNLGGFLAVSAGLPDKGVKRKGHGDAIKRQARNLLHEKLNRDTTHTSPGGEVPKDGYSPPKGGVGGVKNMGNSPTNTPGVISQNN